MPTISNRSAGSRPATRISSPSAKPLSSAVFWSIVVVPGSVAGLALLVGERVEALLARRRTAATGRSARRSGRRPCRRWRRRPPGCASAAATPSVARTFSSVPGGSGCGRPPNSASTAFVAVTLTSTPLDTRSNRSLKDSSIVSVKTNVPATKATPMTTAKPVSAVRSLRASSPRRASRLMATPPASSGRAGPPRCPRPRRGPPRRRAAPRRGRRPRPRRRRA